MSDPSPVPPASTRPDLVRKVELLISNLLRIGVITSLIVVLAGLSLSLWRHPEYRHFHHALEELTSSNHPAWQTLGELVAGLKATRGEAIIMAGLLLLIATPVMRVAVSVVAFMVEKDWKFVGITLFVLAVLILSFILGKAE